MLRLIVLSIAMVVINSGCATLEQECENAISQGRTHYRNTAECVQAEGPRRAAASAAAAQSLNQFSNSLNQMQGPRVDLNCVNRCTAAGSMLDFCNSRCAY